MPAALNFENDHPIDDELTGNELDVVNGALGELGVVVVGIRGKNTLLLEIQDTDKFTASSRDFPDVRGEILRRLRSERVRDIWSRFSSAVVNQ